jgi:hypothetical protein
VAAVTRKQVLITEAQNNYLRTLSVATGESQCHFVRQALDLLAKHYTPAKIPSIIKQPNKS